MRKEDIKKTQIRLANIFRAFDDERPNEIRGRVRELIMWFNTKAGLHPITQDELLALNNG